MLVLCSLVLPGESGAPPSEKGRVAGPRGQGQKRQASSGLVVGDQGSQHANWEGLGPALGLRRDCQC